MAKKAAPVVWYRQWWQSLRARQRSFLNRRPHRSFRPTKRRDYKRSLVLPGYFSFIKQVAGTLWQYRRTFLLLVLCYVLLSAILVGLASQTNYSTLVDTLKKTSTNVLGGAWGELGKASLLFVSDVDGSITPTLQPDQQVYAVILVLLVWLSTVWLLRNLMAGHRVKLRDGLYNAGAPILPTFIVFCVLIVQLLPAALAVLAYVAATQTQIISSGGIAAALFWLFAALLVLLSLFWVIGTVIALVVVTQPGMYPFKALRIAGDMVVGRRIRILLRVLWLVLVTAVLWAVILIPFILLDSWLKSLWPVINWLPIVPVVFLLLSSVTVVWMAAYVYILYRKVLDDDALPA